MLGGIQVNYPTIKEVEEASHEQICRWWRFLPSPGSSAIGTKEFTDLLEKEAKVMNRIGERLETLGGFTPEISKRIGWKK